MTTSFHVPPLPADQIVGELKNILLAGIERHPATRLVADPGAADYVLLDFRHLDAGRHDPAHGHKTIIVDFRDDWAAVYPHEAVAYLKRSVVDPSRGELCDYDRPIVPISYCVRDAYRGRDHEVGSVRDIDVSVFLRPDRPPEQAHNRHRAAVACFVEDRFSDRRIFVGIAGHPGRVGRNSFQPEYFSTMARSKIVVTCNPDRWEGDYRLFEALSSGAMVIVDRMRTPVVHPFVDHRHLVYYDRTRLSVLGDAIEHYLADDAGREAVADAGFVHTMRHHTTVDRIDEILAVAQRASDDR